MYYGPQFDPNAGMQAMYRAQVAGMVLAPANRVDGSIRLKSNPRNLYTYLILLAFVILSPLSFLFMDVPVYIMVLSFVPALFVLMLILSTVFKMKTILINEHEISIQHTLSRKKVYGYGRIVSMQCLPPAKVSGNFHGSIPLQNVMILTFDNKKTLKLPVVMPGYADLFEIISSNTSFESEISKIVQYYSRLGIDIRNRRVFQGANPASANPFEGFADNSGANGTNGGSSGFFGRDDLNNSNNNSGNGSGGSDPNNPFDGF